MSRRGTPRPSNGTMFKGSPGSPLVEGVALVGLASPKSVFYLGQRKGFMLQKNNRLLKVRKDGSKRDSQGSSRSPAGTCLPKEPVEEPDRTALQTSW